MASIFSFEAQRAPILSAASAKMETMLLDPDVLGDDDGDEPIASVMREVSRQLEADGTLLTWHDGDASPMLLFADGLCERRSATEQAMLATARLAAAQHAHASQSQWRALDELEHGGMLTTSIPAGTGVVTITSLFQRIGATTRARARDALARLLPMMRPFFGLWTARLRALSRVRGLTAAVDKSDVGVVLVNRVGRVLFTNAAADALIARHDVLRCSNGLLSGARLSDTLRLQAAIEHVVQRGAPVPPTTSAPVVALHRANGRPLLAAIVGSEKPPVSADESAAVIYLFDPERDLRPLIEPACKLYGLSPVETRLACLLTDCIALADAAERMHIREQTARSYLKQIFLKTDTNRQAELVWLMLKSSVRTAPECHATLV